MALEGKSPAEASGIKIDDLEKLEKEDIDTLTEMIRSLHGTLRNQQQEQKKTHQFPPSDSKDKQAGAEAADSTWTTFIFTNDWIPSFRIALATMEERE